MGRLQAHAVFGSSQARVLDQWDDERRGRLLRWIAEAGRRLRYIHG